MQEAGSIGARLRYRAGQFFRALSAYVPEEETEHAVQLLPVAARPLFHRQSAQDRRHALAVYHALRGEGHTDPSLLAAALLHDAGKAAAWLPAWLRAIIVLLEHGAPRLLARLGSGEGRGWRRPFVAYVHHAARGARWAQEAGCSPLTVTLIRRHHERPGEGQPSAAAEERLLALLQAADGRY